MTNSLMGKSFFGQQFQIFLPISQKQNKTNAKIQKQNILRLSSLIINFYQTETFFLCLRDHLIVGTGFIYAFQRLVNSK